MDTKEIIMDIKGISMDIKEISMNMKETLMGLLLAILAMLPINGYAQFGPITDFDTKYATDLPKEGAEAPDFKLKTIDGKSFKLSKLRGHFVVLDFWASWCPDCRRDMPDMKRIYDTYHAKGAEFVGVSFDTDKEAWANAIKKYSISYTQVSELKKMRETEIYKAYGIKWIPSYIVLSPDGKVVLSTVLTYKLEKKLMEIFPDDVKHGGTREDVTIDGSKGKLSACIIKPGMQEGEKVPVAIIMHGFTGNKESTLLENISKELVKRGIASVRFDFNGHGKSEGNFEDMTVLNEIEDAKKVYEYVSSLPWVGSIALVGHSQGGVVASMTAGELGTDKVKAVVLLAPAAVLREDAIRGNTQGALYDPLDPPAKVELPGGRHLSIGAAYIRTAFSLPIYETAQKYQGPALMIHGNADHIVPYTYSERYHNIWPKSQMVLLDHFDHGFSQNQYRPAELTADFLAEQMK